MGQLTIRFHGVCTHFIGQVPGVPHRVVLPDATALHLGILNVPGTPVVNIIEDGTPYFLMPHFAVLRAGGPVLPRVNNSIQATLTVNGVSFKGNIFHGVHLQVANALGTDNQYDLTFGQVPHLKEYVDHYIPSEEVIRHERAAAYFDLFGADVKSTDTNVAIDTIARITTNGTPKLRMTPFFGGPPHEFLLAETGQEEVELLVANQGMDCGAPTNELDFLLHYLTATTGIPRRLKYPTPGIQGPVPSVAPSQLGSAAALLAPLEYPFHFNVPCLDPEALTLPELITSLACSNSQFP